MLRSYLRLAEVEGCKGKMKICIIIWRMSFSGAENVASAIVNQLSEEGHDVHIVLTSSRSPVIDHNRYTIHNATFEGNAVLRVIKRCLFIRKLVNRERFDVVVGFGHIDSIHMLRALVFSNVTKIACERMDPVTYPFTKRLRLERDFMYRTLDGIIVQTTAQKEYYEEHLNVRCYVIPNPVRSIEFEAVPVEQRNNEFVTVARLDNAQKNHVFMFSCFEEFLTKYPDYVLRLYGDGPDKDKYIEYIKSKKLEDKIILCGRVENPQAFMTKSRAFLLTSNHEGMPNALIEAMSMGLPCISIDCGGGGVRDLIDDGINGFIVKKNDQSDFVNKMVCLVESNDVQQRISMEALQVREKLEIKHITSMWVEAFKFFRREKIC